MLRCLNDIAFGYCAGLPKEAVNKNIVMTVDFGGVQHKHPVKVTICLKDHHTCGQHLTNEQVTAKLRKLELATPSL